MSPQLLGSGLYAIISSIIGFDQCTNIVNDELSKRGISGQLDLPWYCSENLLTTTTNPTMENFELAIKTINSKIGPTSQSPVSWLGETLASVADWGGEKVGQISILTNLALLFLFLVILLLMLMIISVVFAMIYFLFRCCFQFFPVRKRKMDSTPQMYFGDMKKLMVAVQRLGGDEDDKHQKMKKDIDPELDLMAELARVANNPETMNALYKAFSEAQNAEENHCRGKMRFYPDLDTFSVQEISEDQEVVHF